ncbi:MAG: hypothetical protein WCP73_09795, partial [Eubacteriales bacterium]
MTENNKRNKYVLPLLAAVCILTVFLLFACANNAALPSQEPPSAALQPSAPPVSTGLIVPSPVPSATSAASPAAVQPT